MSYLLSIHLKTCRFEKKKECPCPLWRLTWCRQGAKGRHEQLDFFGFVSPQKKCQGSSLLYGLHPGRLTAGTYKSPIFLERNMIWTKPPWLCSMLIFRGVLDFQMPLICRRLKEWRMSHPAGSVTWKPSTPQMWATFGEITQKHGTRMLN